MWNCNILDWDFKPRRPLQNCEHQQWNEIKQHFKSPNDSRGIDYPTWKLNNGKFSIASVKKAFSSLNQIDDFNIDDNTFSQLWKTKILKKCRFFTWSLLHCCINTCDILKRKVPTLNISPNWCSLCKRHSKEIDHIFIDCHTAKILWNKLEELLGWKNQQQNVVSLCSFLCSIKIKQRNKRGIIFFNIIASVLWILWLERNNGIFKDKEKSTIDLWEDIISLSGYGLANTLCLQIIGLPLWLSI